MISEIVSPEKRDVSYEFDLPVMVVHNSDPNYVVILNKFYQNEDGLFGYHGYSLEKSRIFLPICIYDVHIKNWSRFKGKVVLSNFAENE